MKRPPLAFLATVGALVLGIGVSSATLARPHQAAAAVPAPAVVAVAQAVRVCPDPSGTPNRQSAMVATGTSTSAGQSGSSTGNVTAGLLQGPQSTLLSAAGHTAERAWTKPAPPLVLRASGPFAPDFQAVQESRADGGAARGLAATRCVAPGNRFTFIGVGTTVGEDPRLYLSNPDDVPALVDVTVTGAKGALPSTSGQGLRIAPHAQTVLRLVGIAPDQADLAVDVTARTGRVAAALRDTRQRGNDPRGVDWVPATAPAANSLVVPGIYPHAGQQQLAIFDPTDTDATVQVQVVRADGAFVPTGLDHVTVAAGTLRTIDISGPIGGRDAALHITGDQPVQAGVVTTLAASDGFADTAFTAAAGPIDDVVVPSLPGRTATGETAGVQLVAPGGAARVRVVPLTGDGPGPGPTGTLALRAGSTLVAPGHVLHASEPAGVELQVLPGSGPVYAAAYWYEEGSRGPMVTVLPIVPESRTLVMPVVVPDPLAPLVATR